MAIVIKTIKGRQYRYLQESYRVPGRKNPKSRMKYLGPLVIMANERETPEEAHDRGMRAAERFEERRKAENERRGIKNVWDEAAKQASASSPSASPPSSHSSEPDSRDGG